MSEETKTETKTTDWKKLPVKNAEGQNWQELHDFVVRQHKNFGIEEGGRDKSGDNDGNYRGVEEARKAHALLRTHEQFHNVPDGERIHRTTLKGFGSKYINTTPEDEFNDKQTTTHNNKPVVYLGGKKRKTKRKKPKRKKRKTKRRKKTRKHKRRKKRKTRKR
jgi:hypothetical protein